MPPKAMLTPDAGTEEDLKALDLSKMPGYLLRRGRQRALDLYQEEMGGLRLRPRQFVLLLMVYRNGGISQTELVELTGIDRSTTADMVARLVGRGLLRRRRTDADQRANALWVSDAGIELLRQAAPRVARAQERFLAPLAPQLRDVFVHYLAVVAGLSPGDSVRVRHGPAREADPGGEADSGREGEESVQTIGDEISA